MSRIPLSIIIDDPAPGIHLYRYHVPNGCAKDGRELLPFVPNSFLRDFINVAETHGIRGKFSCVPMPACKGSLTSAIEGVTDGDLREWIELVKTRVMPNFDICPEILTHERAIDLSTGRALSENEMEWASHQDRSALAPYIAKAIELLCEAGLTPTGVTSPWAFGIEVEDEYAAAVALAFDKVLGCKKSWYFLHTILSDASVLPVKRYDDGSRSVASISATFSDPFWRTIDIADTSAEFVSSVADAVITADGRGGRLLQFVECGGSPILLTHWQSLYSNGSGTGLRALELVCRRIEDVYQGKIEWVNFSYLMNRALN